MTEQAQVAQQETQVTVRPKAVVPTEWGDREEIIALANRLKGMMPGDLTTAQSLLLAQYSAAMDANPFRGEIYAYESKGKMILVEGYKLLVRWARRQCQFYERYERITNDTDAIPEGAIALRCRILRQDAVGDLAELTQAGVPNAYEICSIEAVGVVTKEDTWSKRHNKPIDPPKGWTWEDVARKRALKNALNRAYGTPSPREIAQETWMVEDTLTIPSDWEDVTPEMLPAEREATALYSAKQRLSPPLEESAVKSIDLLFGPAMEDEPLSEKPPEPELEAETKKPPPNGSENGTGAATPGNGNGWHQRFDLIGRAREGIPYYGDKPVHIIGALKKLDGLGTIQWSDSDEVIFGALNLYARQRADEKAASTS